MHHALWYTRYFPTSLAIAICRFRIRMPFPTQEISISPDIAAPARRYRAFKEPALDVLLRVLDDLSPPARCLESRSITTTKLGTHGGEYPTFLYVCSFREHISFYAGVFIYKTAYSVRVGYPSKLHTSRSVCYMLPLCVPLAIGHHLPEASC